MARRAASRPSGVLGVFLLGAFRVERDSHPLHLTHRKVELLFAYLILHPQEHSREKLAALFWGDSSDIHARHSFRTALTAIRKAFGDKILLADRTTVQINPAYPIWVDAVEFERTVEGAPSAESAPSAQGDPSALDLYQGDLLADFYDDWILPEREHYRDLYLTALLRLVQEMRALSEYERAIAYAQRVLASEPTNERAHQHLIFCYVALGNRTAALKQYAECVRILRDDLAVEPTRETTALAEWIERAPAAHPPSEARLTNLPIPLTSFIGRKREMAEGKRLIASQRLVTLTGAGGSGKTRLAIQIATDLVDAFRDGVWWVELAALTEGALVPQAVAQALGVREVPNQPLSETLVHFLHARQLLLVLDNCEHLVNACAELAIELLSVCPDLKVLATSREALGLTGEVAWPVPTLALPDPKQVSLQDLLMQFEGIRLFVERAVVVKPDFVVTPQNARAVVEVCRRLDGIPLAIELAAARIKILTVEHIAARLDDRFNLLTTGSRTALPRQKTLRATIDWSYDLLIPETQKLFRRLSVFAGGFTLDAAEAVCTDESLERSTVLKELSRLVDRSLVLVEQQDRTERYRMLETIRDYAYGKLVELSEADEIRKKHGRFF
ncbi:MAG TPA: BTAD domain-containing putative transcriptional regulator, partial [Anaerolineae bacterium]